MRTREICPLDRGSSLSIVPTQHFWTVRSSGLHAARGVFLGWESLHCKLMQICHCASVTVNLVSLTENSEIKKRSSFLLSDSLEWNDHFKDLSFPSSQFLCWHLRFMISKTGSQSSSGSGVSPVLETEVVSDQADHTLCQTVSAPLLMQPKPRGRVE